MRSGRSATKTKESAVKKIPNRVNPGIRHLAQELNREDSQLRSYLLDAALAALRLARNPESHALKDDAAQVWALIEPILSHHLNAEDSQVLPWVDEQGRLSTEVGRNVRESHERLRTLVGAIVDTGAVSLTEAEARDSRSRTDSENVSCGAKRKNPGKPIRARFWQVRW